MKNTLAFVACGLLVLALGCGDDKNSTPSGTDAGPTATGGKGGGTGGAKAGTGGTGSGTGGAKAGTGGAAALTTDQCVTMTTALMVPNACAQCVCKNDIKNSQVCIKDANCWPLLDCLGKNCPNDPMAGCYMTACSANAMGIGSVAMIGPTITGMCKDECVPKTPATDGGTDAGN